MTERQTARIHMMIQIYYGVLQAFGPTAPETTAAALALRAALPDPTDPTDPTEPATEQWT